MHWILKLILHLFFWCTYCLFAGLISFRLNEGFDFIVRHAGIFIWNGIWAAVIFYLHYLFLFRIVFRREYLKYFLSSVVLSFLVSALFFTIIRFIYFPSGTFVREVMFIPSFAGTFIIGNCGSLLKGFISWFTESERKAELQKQSLHIELEMLRSQLNHHFLFNTLNNIDALIFKDPQKASDALIALSSILRYMLYDTTHEKVPLENELKNIENILHLEQLRIAVPGFAKIEAGNEVRSAMVPPLLFVSFVENACKHSGYAGVLPMIDIRFHMAGNRLKFVCNNSVNGQNSGKSTGQLGLANIQRRLNLLYGSTYLLEISANKTEFNVSLEIPV